MATIVAVLCLLCSAKPGICLQNFHLISMSGDDDATQMAGGLTVDDHGNIIHGGMFKGTLEIGGISVASKGQNDVFLVKHRTGGDVEWVRSFGSTDDEDLRSIASDHEGNIIILGNFRSNALSFDNIHLNQSVGIFHFFLTKFNARGQVQWAVTGRRHAAVGQDLVVDDSGNIYVTGHLTSGGMRGFVSKYSSSGEEIFSVSGYGQGTSNPHVIALDPEGNILIAGSFTGMLTFGKFTIDNPFHAENSVDVFITKFSNDGQPVWMRQLTGTYSEMAYGIASDHAGNVYVTGSYELSASLGQLQLNVTEPPPGSRPAEIFLIKIDPDGEGIWARTNQISNGSSHGFAVTVNSNGEILLAGEFAYRFANKDGGFVRSCGRGDVLVIKYDVEGNMLELAKAGGNHDDFGRYIAEDTEGNIYVQGEFESQHFDLAQKSVVLKGKKNVFLARLPSSGWSFSGVDTSTSDSPRKCGDAITFNLANSCTSFPQTHSTLPENLEVEIGSSESGFSSPSVTLDGSVVNFFDYSAKLPQDLETGEYIFRLLSSGSPISSFVSLEITCERDIEETHVNIANVFTPNGDGINDIFAPEYEGDFPGSLRIYNRLGREIFYTGEVKLGWSGNNAESGMYYYAITLAQKKYTGWVHLLK